MRRFKFIKRIAAFSISMFAFSALTVNVSYAAADDDVTTLSALMDKADEKMEAEEYEEAIAILEEAEKMSMKENKKEEQGTVLHNLGKCYYYIERTQEAILFFNKACEVRKTALGENHRDYASSLNNLGICYANLGDYQKAIEYFEKALEIRKQVLGENHPDYANSLNNLGICYFNLFDYPTFIIFHEEYLDIVSRNILQNFSFLPSSQRVSYWKKYSYQLTTRQSGIARQLSDSPSVLSRTYDCQLLSKGLLLNAETEMRDMILSSNDEKVLNLYDSFCLTKRELALQMEKPIAERTMPTDSLEKVSNDLEAQLLKSCKVFGDYTKNLAVRWTDVQSRLGAKDIAIEFIEVPVSEDSTIYCALTLKKGYDAPHFTELFDLKDLQELNAKYSRRTNSDGLVYSDPQLYNLVWKPLENELKGVKNIYFGPAGELYQIAIEYADNGKGPFSTQKNLFRLSSTRQLAVIRDEGKIKTASVFGGFKYGESIESLLADSRNYTASRSMTTDYFFSTDSLSIRGASGGFGVQDLPGTMEEATTIAGLMNGSKVEATLTTGEKGTEAAFKAISGTDRNIIHIATHGFYWTKIEADRMGKRIDRYELMSDRDDRRTKEDESLTRSGLLFSGANNALKKGYVRQEGLEDGILTAKEISRMDLRGTDLLVLSACQTGLGEVSGDGVFGLQRGFKKAGVNAILMSLWEVDDDATMLLMSTFYKNLTAGKSKADALKIAQEKVRNTHGYESPRYWAAFILLDGTD